MVQTISQEHVRNRMEEQILDVPARQFQAEKLIKNVQFIPQEPLQNYMEKQICDVPIAKVCVSSQFLNKLWCAGAQSSATRRKC